LFSYCSDQRGKKGKGKGVIRRVRKCRGKREGRKELGEGRTADEKRGQKEGGERSFQFSIFVADSRRREGGKISRRM